MMNYKGGIEYKITKATEKDIEWIGDLEASVYSGGDPVPKDVLMDWYGANPNSFWIVTMNKKKAGHIDILPVRDEIFNKFIKGEITEQYIKGSDLYSPLERDKIRDLYIESLAIDISEKFARAKALYSVLSEFSTIAEILCNTENINNIYAISASDKGSALLKHLGFQIHRRSNERIDGHDLFISSFQNFAKRFMRPPEKAERL